MDRHDGRSPRSEQPLPHDGDTAMITILLVDDRPSVLSGLCIWLANEPDLEVVGETRDAATAVALAAELRPDIVLMDVGMPGMDGVAATAALQDQSPRTVVVILSIHDDQHTRQRARAAGAVAFVPKHRMTEELLPALRMAAAEPRR
jgi:DNA-binding NarL/FixJ family response regulator